MGFAAHFAKPENVIQNWQTPEVNVESYDFDLYTCAWIEKVKSANRWKYQSHEHPPDALDLSEAKSEVVDLLD